MKSCAWLGCVALAVDGLDYCTVHFDYRALLQPPQLTHGLRPVTEQIERDADGLPIRFYPEVKP